MTDDAPVTVAGKPVSRETHRRLETLGDLLRKWNPAINLVSRASLDDLWRRHILDSAQLVELAPHGVVKWADLGSGGGFPGLVVAILLHEVNPMAHVVLIEADGRKCAFLARALKETGVSATVVHARIEAATPAGADVVSARALAPLKDLIRYARRHMAPDGVALFPKGRGYEAELTDALEQTSFLVQKHASRTESGAVILEIRGLTRD